MKPSFFNIRILLILLVIAVSGFFIWTYVNHYLYKSKASEPVSASYLIRLVYMKDGTYTEYRCPLDPNANLGARMEPSQCTTIRTLNIGTNLQHTSEFIGNYKGTDYLMRTSRLRNGEVTGYRCNLNRNLPLGADIADPSRCVNLRSNTYDNVQHTSDWIGNYQGTNYLMVLTYLIDGMYWENRCPLDPNEPDGVSYDRCSTSIRRLNIGTGLQYFSQWIGNYQGTDYLMRLIYMKDGTYTEYRCPLDPNANLGARMEPSQCTTIRTLNIGTGLQYTSEWIATVNTTPPAVAPAATGTITLSECMRVPHLPHSCTSTLTWTSQNATTVAVRRPSGQGQYQVVATGVGGTAMVNYDPVTGRNNEYYLFNIGTYPPTELDHKTLAIGTTSPAATATTVPVATATTAPVCLQVVTYAKNPTTNVCETFGNSCVPDGWESCTPPAATITPPGGVAPNALLWATGYFEPASPTDTQDVTINFNRNASVNFVNLIVGTEEFGAQQQEYPLAAGASTFIWRNNAPGHTPGVHTVGIKPYYCSDPTHCIPGTPSTKSITIAASGTTPPAATATTVPVATATTAPVVTPGLFQARVKFKVMLPDVAPSVTTIPAGNVRIEIFNEATRVASIQSEENLVRSGNYFVTADSVIVLYGDEITVALPANNTYRVAIKVDNTVRRIFNNVKLTLGERIDCTVAANVDCGELITRRDDKFLLSGDSDQFNTTSGSYNKVDSADLFALAAHFNTAASTDAKKAVDFNRDGQVSIADLEIFGRNYRQHGD